MLASRGQNLLYLYATCCNSTFIHNFDDGLCTYESFFKKRWLRPMNDLLISFSLLTLDVRKSQHNCVQRIFTLKSSLHCYLKSSLSNLLDSIQTDAHAAFLSRKVHEENVGFIFRRAYCCNAFAEKSIREIHKMILSNNKSMSSL